MEGERPRKVTGHDTHFIKNYAEHEERWEITDDHVQYVLDHAEEGFFERQSNGLWKFKVFVPDLGYVLRTIIAPDGKIHTAYEDRVQTRSLFRRR